MATSLSRQGSLYSLTFDEVESQLGNLGKPLGSMNLDELLRTVWTGEAVDSPSISMNRQLSISVCRDLSKRTVEEVWKEIQLGNGETNQERQSTFGEMTLEDFLAQAGVGVESDNGTNRNAQWIQPQMNPLDQMRNGVPMIMPNQYIQKPPISANGGLILEDSAYLDTSITGRKRVGCDVAEKTVERRLTRMIKNRESAARSRSRKQAYTHELEIKLSRLEEENERLQKLKKLEKELPSAPPPEPKYQLRRTTSASF